jgi:hypothetical protein
VNIFCANGAGRIAAKALVVQVFAHSANTSPQKIGKHPAAAGKRQPHLCESYSAPQAADCTKRVPEVQ